MKKPQLGDYIKAECRYYTAYYEVRNGPFRIEYEALNEVFNGLHLYCLGAEGGNSMKGEIEGLNIDEWTGMKVSYVNKSQIPKGIK